MKKVEQWSLLYEILRPFGRFIFWMAHRKIVVTGTENIPKGEPVIMAPNHQNALSDDLAMVFYLKQQPVFLGRADMFKNKTAAKLLNFLKVIPVFRIRDGKDTLDRNKAVYENCVQILKQNKTICIYPEAGDNRMKSMIGHKKPIPRIAFYAAEATNFEMDVKVVPVGMYYSHYYHFRRELYIAFGKPISSKDYYKLFREEGEAKAINKFRNDLFEAIRKLIVHVPDKKSYDLYDSGFEMFRAKVLEKLGLKNHLKNKVKAEQYLSEKINEALENEETEKDDLLKKSQTYKRLKKRFNFNEKELAKGEIGVSGFIANMLLAIILLPIAAYGTLANGWLFYLTRFPYRKKIKDDHFYSTISYGLSFILFPLWFIGQYFILHSIFDSWLIAIGLLIFSIPSGVVAWEIGQLILSTFHRLKYNQLQKTSNKLFKQLLDIRIELIRFFTKTIG
ncbi:MAG: 1-acyl-sn-glycerol-3-phosphate acyltransferase [Prolixibacteraceae bacterium]